MVRVTGGCGSARPTALATKPEAQMSVQNPQLVYDPAERAAEKQRSREADERALASGELTREQLTAKNAYFSFPPEMVEIDFAAVRPLRWNA
jgi:hypothetical protein